MLVVPTSVLVCTIAELRGIGIDDAREELERAGARFEAVARDGYWSPR
jgi:hypothetical protein